MKNKLFLVVLLLGFYSQAQLIEPKKVDDRLHFALGWFVGESAMIFNENILKLECNFCASVGSAFLAGTLKETIDSNESDNRFDGGELLSTTLGGAFAYGFKKLLVSMGVPPEFVSGFVLATTISYIGFEMVFRIK